MCFKLVASVATRLNCRSLNDALRKLVVLEWPPRFGKRDFRLGGDEMKIDGQVKNVGVTHWPTTFETTRLTKRDT